MNERKVFDPRTPLADAVRWDTGPPTDDSLAAWRQFDCPACPWHYRATKAAHPLDIERYLEAHFEMHKPADWLAALYKARDQVRAMEIQTEAAADAVEIGVDAVTMPAHRGSVSSAFAMSLLRVTTLARKMRR